MASNSESDAPAADKPLGVLLVELRDEGLALAQAKADLLRIEAGEKARTFGIYAAIAAAGMTLAFGALIALLVGLILIVGASLGLGWAVALVTLGALLVAALLGFAAYSGIRRLFARRPDA